MFSSLLLASVLTFAPVNATSETITTEPTTIVAEESTTTTTVDTQTDLENYVDELVSKYSNIDTWLALIFGGSTGVSLISIISTLIVSKKNGRNAKQTEEAVLKVINQNLGTAYESLTKENMIDLLKRQEITQDLIKLMIKAFAFAQDKSADGKKALLDLMLEINELNGNDKEIAKQLATKKEEITKVEEKVAETNKKVESEYIPVD